MNTQRMLGVSLTNSERAKLEQLADHMVSIGRNFDAEAYVLDEGNNERLVANIIFSQSWDLKQIARFGTPSFGI